MEVHLAVQRIELLKHSRSLACGLPSSPRDLPGAALETEQAKTRRYGFAHNFSGEVLATSSISIPPSEETMNRSFRRTIQGDRYIKFLSNIECLSNHHLLHEPPLRSGLMRYKVIPKISLSSRVHSLYL